MKQTEQEIETVDISLSLAEYKFYDHKNKWRNENCIRTIKWSYYGLNIQVDTKFIMKKQYIYIYIYIYMFPI
jgi:hypothetical protein